MTRPLRSLALALAGVCLSGALSAASSASAAPLAAPAPVPGASAATAFPERVITPAQLKALRHGGYVLYLRHATTDTNRPDRAPAVDLNDCATQRVLTEAGRQLARQVGQAVRNARIPVSEVWASPMCRTRDTARLAFGDRVQVDPELMYTANMTAAQKQPLLAHVRQRLSAPVATGGNRVLVSHASNLADLIGYYIVPEGTLAVFAPRGNDQFDYLGSIHPDDWPALLR